LLSTSYDPELQVIISADASEVANDEGKKVDDDVDDCIYPQFCIYPLARTL